MSDYGLSFLCLLHSAFLLQPLCPCFSPPLPPVCMNILFWCKRFLGHPDTGFFAGSIRWKVIYLLSRSILHGLLVLPSSFSLRLNTDAEACLKYWKIRGDKITGLQYCALSKARNEKINKDFFYSLNAVNY